LEVIASPQANESVLLWVRKRALTAETLVGIASGVWALAFGVVCFVMFEQLLNRRFDLGNMTQAVWSTAHGHPLEVTAVTGEQINRLAVHVDPILVLFAPLWWIWPSPLLLMTIQVIALAAGAFPVFWFARKYLPSERAALYVALAYLLYPALQWHAMNDFHPTNIAVALLLFAIWYLEERRLAMFSVLAIGAIATQEQVGLVIAGIGLIYAFRNRWSKFGLVVAGVGASWTAFCLGFVIPHFAHGGNPNTSRFESVGGSPSGIVLTLFTHPLRIADALHSNDLAFLFLVSAPFLGLFILAPEWLLPALPQLALPLLSARATDTTINNHLFSPVIPFLVVATIVGIARLGGYAEHGARLVLAASALSLVIGPLPWLHNLAHGKPARVRAADVAVSMIGERDAVSSTNHLGSMLSARRHVYTFPVVERAVWVVVDESDQLLPPPRKSRKLIAPVNDLTRQPARFKAVVSRMRHDSRWALVFSRDGVLVFHRVSRTDGGET
jgi:uncharacterized membrane protein